MGEDISRPFGKYRPPRERRRWPAPFTPETRANILHHLAAGETVEAVAKVMDIAPGPIAALVAQLAMEELGEPVDPSDDLDPDTASTSTTSTTTPEPAVVEALSAAAAAFLGIRQ